MSGEQMGFLERGIIFGLIVVVAGLIFLPLSGFLERRKVAELYGHETTPTQIIQAYSFHPRDGIEYNIDEIELEGRRYFVTRSSHGVFVMPKPEVKSEPRPERMVEKWLPD